MNGCLVGAGASARSRSTAPSPSSPASSARAGSPVGERELHQPHDHKSAADGGRGATAPGAERHVHLRRGQPRRLPPARPDELDRAQPPARPLEPARQLQRGRGLERLRWESRELYEYAAAIVPVSDHPIHKTTMRLFPDAYDGAWPERLNAWARDNAALRRAIVSQLRKQGPLPSREIEDIAEASWR